MRQYAPIGHGVEVSPVLCSRTCKLKAVKRLAYGAVVHQAPEDEGYCGVFVSHTHPDGSTCEGFVQWCLGCADSKDHVWTLIKSDPLTLSPSLLRDECKLHGFIVNGVWTLC